MDMYSYHEGENVKKRGFAPLKLPFNIFLNGEGGKILRREASPPFNSPRF